VVLIDTTAPLPPLLPHAAAATANATTAVVNASSRLTMPSQASELLTVREWGAPEGAPFSSTSFRVER
jgi:hypothetical protein